MRLVNGTGLLLMPGEIGILTVFKTSVLAYHSRIYLPEFVLYLNYISSFQCMIFVYKTGVSSMIYRPIHKSKGTKWDCISYQKCTLPWYVQPYASFMMKDIYLNFKYFQGIKFYCISCQKCSMYIMFKQCKFHNERHWNLI